MLSPRAEELLSYLIGLGPVGKPVKLYHQHVVDDIGMNRTNMLGILQRLITKDVITRCGPSLYRVLDRTVLDGRVKKKSEPPREKKRRTFVCIATRYEKRDPIWPPKFDRRDLTAFVCGDPLPERSALARRA